jgi:hypothetical protein
VRGLAAIEAEGLRKVFGKVVALDGVSFSSVSTKAPIGMPRKRTMPLDLTV